MSKIHLVENIVLQVKIHKMNECFVFLSRMEVTKMIYENKRIIIYVSSFGHLARSVTCGCYIHQQDIR